MNYLLGLLAAFSCLTSFLPVLHLGLAPASTILSSCPCTTSRPTAHVRICEFLFIHTNIITFSFTHASLCSRAHARWMYIYSCKLRV
ncbi:hypothetical protein BD410DRAFT_359566 [Rickenella mellea]|uniref:Secreted protein n=1 Tax=Rickenella mellea TaxID=50990 RepID=A0A4Y7Q0T2_9AGAM|nr:hypothetical protein BD410DRAFT_359566 [Rickenella mellea]